MKMAVGAKCAASQIARWSKGQRDHFMAVLKNVNRPPVGFCVPFNMLVLTFKILNRLDESHTGGENSLPGHLIYAGRACFLRFGWWPWILCYYIHILVYVCGFFFPSSLVMTYF